MPSKQKEGILLKRPKGITGKNSHQKPKNWLVLGPAIGVIVKNEAAVINGIFSVLKPLQKK